VLWWGFSSVDWDGSDVLINEMPNIWSNILIVCNVFLLLQVLESWVQGAVNSMGFFFSVIWSWFNIWVLVNESMNFFSNLLISNVMLVFLG